jgi:quercetin dioxygenase-like cupin family protein
MTLNYFNNGKLFINGSTVNLENLSWDEHPANKGVFLKHIIKGEETGNQLSCHFVKINPSCEIGLHIHAGKTELHEVLEGSGLCIIEESSVKYKKGVIGFIPADKNHSLKASESGLFLMAKFFPALL